MAVSYSANAVFAKAHALYGKRLKKQDYDALIGCHTLDELTDYLHAETAYSAVFDKASPGIGTAQIEELLRLHLLENFESLCRFEISTGENFYRHFIISNDIKQILTFIRLLILGKPEKYLSSLPPFFNRHTDLDLYAIAKSRTYDELLAALDDSPYAKLIEPFRNTYMLRDVYVRIETALNNYLDRFLLGVLNRDSSKQSSEQIHEILNYKSDMDSIVSIYRLIRLRSADEEEIRSYINTDFTNFSKKEIQMLVQAPLARDMVKLIPNTCYRRDFAKVQYDYLEGATERMLYNKCLHCFRYFTDPTAVMFSYIYLAEIEVRNIINIVEGINYSIPPEKIKAFLIGTES